MPIRAGQLRHPIAFERRGAGKDAHGGPSAAWAELRRTRAQFLPGTGQERREAAQERASAAAVFRVRKRSAAGLREKDRIRFDPEAALPALVAPATTLPDSVPAWDVISIVPYGDDGLDIAAVREELTP